MSHNPDYRQPLDRLLRHADHLHAEVNKHRARLSIEQDNDCAICEASANPDLIVTDVQSLAVALKSITRGPAYWDLRTTEAINKGWTNTARAIAAELRKP